MTVNGRLKPGVSITQANADLGAIADASAAPRASAVSGSSGTLTPSDVAESRAGLIEAMSTPEPSKNRPPGADSSSSSSQIIPVSCAVASS